ncbi:unnamed protein product [Paramecium sonneborni]|uniref:Transmembrane protein n=1 Tax=Paramecium sonneborni TaxID=65129 RepID=A0A8S1RT63_9CILI|nr:unnamed protein product [Paramecium sonneborni]
MNKNEILLKILRKQLLQLNFTLIKSLWEAFKIIEIIEISQNDQCYWKISSHKPFNQNLLELQLHCLGILTYIYTYEGASRFLNGWRYALLQAGVCSSFFMREQENSYNDWNYLQVDQFSFSRALTITMTFPLEYWKVLQSSTVGYSNLKIIQFGTQLQLIQQQFKEIFYYLAFTEAFLKIQKQKQERFQYAQGSNSFTAPMTIPQDIVKKRKQVSIGSGRQMASMEILQNIYNEEGLKRLFQGYQPRIAKITMHSGLAYMMMYECLKQLI